MAQADQTYTDEIQGLYPRLDLPVLVVWGKNDTWIPVDRAHLLTELIPGAQLELIDGAGHLVQLDQPVQLATRLHGWLTSQATT
ncbi:MULTISPECIES: alpha/beta fold hydrolase [unclassified Micromonospora]|uniref:alpha/beta fold hydrolase n=1 Tax=unclassified Micromonospora TaxID=2617518 RepID=UPI003A8B8FE6